MMISRAQIGKILKIYETQGAAHPSSKAVGQADGAASKDKVVLSVSQDDLAKVRELTKKLPEMRLDKVEALRKQIESGNYKVDATEVADKMLGRLLADRIK
ncbi:MAG: flagellar biosynthesis anti-sigma factor FlgM [Bacillota bacterium]|jgi:negative regulator of flagellin synthesis FlgM